MPFENEAVGNFTVVHLDESRFDASVAESFKTYIFDLIESGNSAVVIDLGEVRFMDSSGLGALVAGLKKMTSGGSFSLCLAQPAVKDLFDLTSMDKLFTLYDSIEAATSEDRTK